MAPGVSPIVYSIYLLLGRWPSLELHRITSRHPMHSAASPIADHTASMIRRLRRVGFVIGRCEWEHPAISRMTNQGTARRVAGPVVLVTGIGITGAMYLLKRPISNPGGM